MQTRFKLTSLLWTSQRRDVVGVVLGVLILALTLAGSALYTRRCQRAPQPVLSICEGRADGTWAKVKREAPAEVESVSEKLAEPQLVREDAGGRNSLEPAFTNRIEVVSLALPAVEPADASGNAENRSWLDPLIVPPATECDWRRDIPPSYVAAYDKDDDPVQNRWRFIKTNAPPALLPKVGSEHWRVGLIILPYGPEGVNKQGVQTSSYLLGIKGSLP